MAFEQIVVRSLKNGFVVTSVITGVEEHSVANTIEQVIDAVKQAQYGPVTGSPIVTG